MAGQTEETIVRELGGGQAVWKFQRAFLQLNLPCQAWAALQRAKGNGTAITFFVYLLENGSRYAVS